MRFFKYIILFFLFSSICVFGQNSEKYFVVTVESKQTPNYHGIRTSHWIIPVDSINDSNVFEIYPFYIDYASNDNLERCIEDLPIAIFTSTTVTNYDFPDIYIENIELLKEIIFSNRKKVQSINKKWSDFKEKVNIYLTPIDGDFCSCGILNGSIIDKWDVNYELMFLPVKNFRFDLNLWNTEKGKEILRSDFSEYTFGNHI